MRGYKNDPEFYNTKMPIGQYNGLLIREIKDKQYLEWADENLKLSVHVKYAIILRLSEL